MRIFENRKTGELVRHLNESMLEGVVPITTYRPLDIRYDTPPLSTHTVCFERDFRELTKAELRAMHEEEAKKRHELWAKPYVDPPKFVTPPKDMEIAPGFDYREGSWKGFPWTYEGR